MTGERVLMQRELNRALVDGVVAGMWRLEKRGVELQPFRRLDPATRRALREEADRLADFHT